ncbi:MAG: HAD hydrolase-like protein, partial [Clostridia bacterium]|nr:HAD hydrolase-like protein [Clostridia bacterium]
MKKLIIFDMDGVLVDSEEAIAQASIESLSEWGVSAKLSDFKQ